MPATQTATDRVELRRDSRYLTPILDVFIGMGQFRAINWSMGGLLLDGVCHDIGSRVRGITQLDGSAEIMPFRATVVRIDPEFGSCAICFDDPGIAGVEEDEDAVADRFH